MKFTLEINTTAKGCEVNLCGTLANLLTEVARNVSRNALQGEIRDSQGSCVGRYTIIEGEAC